MKSVEIGEATATLASYIQNLGREPLIVSFKATPVALLTPICDLDTLPLDTHPEALTLIKKSLKRQRDDAQASLADYVRNLGIAPAIVGFKGQAIALLVAIADYETVSLSYNPKFQAIIEQSRKQQQAGKGTSSEEVRKKLGLE